MIKFNDNILYSWKDKFKFTSYEHSLLFNNDMTIPEDKRNLVFNNKQNIEFQKRFFNHILYSNISSNNYKVSFDTCATNIINKLFERYATSNTLIITTNSEHPSVVYNLNKYNDDNIIYIDNMLSIFDIKNKISKYTNILIYVCATPALSINIVQNELIENIQIMCKKYNKHLVTILDDVQGMFLYPRDYRIYNYIIGTAHAIIPGFNLGFVISNKQDDICNLYSQKYEEIFIDMLDHILKYKSLLYQYSMILTQYYSTLLFYNNKFKLYNELPFKFFIIDQGKIDYERKNNPKMRIPMYLIGSTDVCDNNICDRKINSWYKEISIKNNKLYYSTGLLRATLSILNFDDFINILHKMNMIINNMNI